MSDEYELPDLLPARHPRLVAVIAGLLATEGAVEAIESGAPVAFEIHVFPTTVRVHRIERTYHNRPLPVAQEVPQPA